MPRRIKQRNLHVIICKYRLLGKYRDPTLPLLCIRIQVSILMIHPSKLTDLACRI